MSQETQERSLPHIVHKFRSLDCENCAFHMKRVVGRLPGVVNVSADLPTSLGTITYDPSQVQGEELRKMVDDLDRRIERMSKGLPPDG